MRAVKIAKLMTDQLLYLFYQIFCSIGGTSTGGIPSVCLKIIEKCVLGIRKKEEKGITHSSIYADDFYLKAGAKQSCMQNSFLPESSASKSPPIKKRDYN